MRLYALLQSDVVIIQLVKIFGGKKNSRTKTIWNVQAHNVLAETYEKYPTRTGSNKRVKTVSEIHTTLGPSPSRAKIRRSDFFRRANDGFFFYRLDVQV